jgi:hypothetical protein
MLACTVVHHHLLRTECFEMFSPDVEHGDICLLACLLACLHTNTNLSLHTRTPNTYLQPAKICSKCIWRLGALLVFLYCIAWHAQLLHDARAASADADPVS